MIAAVKLWIITVFYLSTTVNGANQDIWNTDFNIFFLQKTLYCFSARMSFRQKFIVKLLKVLTRRHINIVIITS